MKKRIKKRSGQGDKDKKDYFEIACGTCSRTLKMKIGRKPKCPVCNGNGDYRDIRRGKRVITHPTPETKENNTENTSTVENY